MLRNEKVVSKGLIVLQNSSVCSYVLHYYYFYYYHYY